MGLRKGGGGGRRDGVGRVGEVGGNISEGGEGGEGDRWKMGCG